MQQERPKSGGRPKSGVKSGGKTSEKNEKESSEKNAEDQIRGNLKYQYAYLSKRYATQPIVQIKNSIDLAIQTEIFIDQIVVSRENIRPNDMIVISIAFKLYDFLKMFCFWNVNLEPGTLKLMVAFLLQKQKIILLELIDCGITDEDVPLLSSLFEKSTWLNIVNLDHSDFGKGSAAIFQAFADNKSTNIKILSTRYCKITSETSSAIANLLSMTNSLK
jgi:hypothetical protein